MAGDIIKGREHFFNAKYVGNSQGQKVGQMLPFTDVGTIAKSIISNRADNSQLNRTISSGSQRRIFTISCWVKLGTPASGTAGRHADLSPSAGRTSLRNLSARCLRSWFRSSDAALPQAATSRLSAVRALGGNTSRAVIWNQSYHRGGNKQVVTARGTSSGPAGTRMQVPRCSTSESSC